MILGVIPARGGSVRIPKKNIKLLNGVPLIVYMISAAQGSKKIDYLIVSSDDDEIIRVSKSAGVDVPFRRPADISKDVPSEDVIKHSVAFMEEKFKSDIDIVVTMQPTTPFCEAQDIDACIAMLEENKLYDSVFSAKIVRERPEWMFQRVGDRYKLYMEGRLTGERGVTQALPELYIPNGAVYATRKRTLFAQNALVGENCGMYIMSEKKSIDIDEPLDFAFAEFIGKYYEKRRIMEV